MKKIKISPSILAGDFSQLGNEIKKLEKDRHTMYGAAAVLGAIGSMIIWIISNFIRSI